MNGDEGIDVQFSTPTIKNSDLPMQRRNVILIGSGSLRFGTTTFFVTFDAIFLLDLSLRLGRSALNELGAFSTMKYRQYEWSTTASTTP